jgi:transposase-like protein
MKSKRPGRHVQIDVKIRDCQLTNRSIYFALAVTCEGAISSGSGPATPRLVGRRATCWFHVLTELNNRGVNDVLMVVCDGP